MTSVIEIAKHIIDAPSESVALAAARNLGCFGSGAVEFARERGIRVVLLARADTYCSRSPRLKELAPHLDTWPAPPAGLFVVEERTVYLRSRSPLAICHEFGHALDLALGGDAYFSNSDPEICAAFSAATGFVTPYAATARDEYVAESLRAWVEANDRRSPWPLATRERLRSVDPRMYAIVEGIFHILNGAQNAAA